MSAEFMIGHNMIGHKKLISNSIYLLALHLHKAAIATLGRDHRWHPDAEVILAVIEPVSFHTPRKRWLGVNMLDSAPIEVAVERQRAPNEDSEKQGHAALVP